MNESISVVREHQNFLKLVPSANGELKDVFLGFGNNSFEVSDGVTNGHGRGIRADASDLAAFLQQILRNFVDHFDQTFLLNAFAVHEEDGGNDRSAHNYYAIGQSVDDLRPNYTLDLLPQLVSH